MSFENDLVIRIGGSAGEGGASTGESITKTLSRHGLNICTYTSYQSAIRGGHNWIQVRASENEAYSQGDGLDLLLALNLETIKIHGSQINNSGGLIYNSDKIPSVDDLVRSDVKKYGVPANQMAKDYGKIPIQNTILTGALINVFNLSFDIYAGVLKTIFGNKLPKIVEMNIEAAQKGYDYAGENYESLGKTVNITEKKRLMISGNQAIALGAVAADCKFYSAYPMTPASSILHWLASHSEQYGVLVKQAEDELAVICMAIGAGHAGVRSMCGTSGGGFALMSEAVGLAGMTETPVVIVESQRAGPSTGLPTKTEQGDLFQVLGAGQGDFPKIILAPRTVEECFYTAAEAFNLSDRYQCPVIIVLDLYLSEHYESVNDLNLNATIDRGSWADSSDQKYARYAFTETGISPRARPGQEGRIFIAGSDEHDEKGNLISDVLAGIPEHIETRKLMMEKRMKKMESALLDMKLPELVGPEDAQITIVGWGSTWGPIKEAIHMLKNDGISANSLQFKYLYPFRSDECESLLRAANNLLLVELNYSGQLGKFLKMETGVNFDNKLLKYDGEPFYPSEIYSKVKELI